MAALSLGSSVLSAVLQVVFDRATTYAQKQLLGVSSDLEASIQKLQMSLSIIQSMISDAEKRLMYGGNAGLKTWLMNLRDVIYDADSMFDLLEYERLKKEILRARRSTTTGSLRYALMKLKLANISKHSFTAKIKGIQDKLDYLLSMATYFKLEMAVEHLKPVDNDYSRGRITFPMVQGDEEEIVGRNEEKDRIISLLLCEETVADDSGTPNVTGNPYTIISIIGMGGLGKTTLAQLIFNDPKVKIHFDLMMWVCISDDFDEDRIIIAILNSKDLKKKELKNENMNSGDYNPPNIREDLKDALKGKKFLLVLDDIWNEDSKKWSDLAKWFNSGKQGSKILITCRSKGVASKMSLSNQIELFGLSEDDFWNLFTKHAFCGPLEIENSLLDELREIGREIVTKLKGSPLAAKTVGRILNSSLNVLHWQSILQSEIWQLPQSEGDILPALRLSYEHLPQHLKPCFAFCSVFPKDFQYEKRDIILMWIALGFVQPIQGRSILLEDIGNNYIDDLLNRSMLQPCKDNMKRFMIHDLLHDKAISVSKDVILTIHGENQVDQFPKAIRHLVISHSDSLKWDILKHLSNLSSLRTLIFLPSRFRDVVHIKRLPNELRIFLRNKLWKATSLRILDLRAYSMYEVPSHLEKLKCLRYLNLAFSRVKCLPSSLTGLFHLQTLSVDGKYTKVPYDTNYLINLRHLHGQGERNVVMNIQELSMLQELCVMISRKGHGIEMLKDMRQICDLDVRQLENVKSKEEAANLSLRDKKHLRNLKLVWCKERHPSTMLAKDAEVLEGLQPNADIKELIIEGYRGEGGSIWLENLSLKNLEHISLERCNNRKILPPLGQLPRLKSLTIKGMEKLREVASDFFGQRSSPTSSDYYCLLSSIHISDCPELKNFLRSLQ